MRWRSLNEVGSSSPNALEEVPDIHPQHPSDLEQPAGRDSIDAAFVLMSLLIGHPNQIGQLLLGEAQHGPPLTNAMPDMPLR